MLLFAFATFTNSAIEMAEARVIMVFLSCERRWNITSSILLWITTEGKKASDHRGKYGKIV